MEALRLLDDRRRDAAEVMPTEARDPRRQGARTRSTRRPARSCRRSTSRRRTRATPSYALIADRDYTRDENPTPVPRRARCSPRSKAAPQALVFASGMAAATAVFRALCQARRSRRSRRSVGYFALRGWLERFCAQWGVALDLVDTTDLDARARRAAPDARGSSGSRRRRTRRGTSPTSRRSPSSRTAPARCSPSTRRARRRCTRSRSRSAPTS